MALFLSSFLPQPILGQSTLRVGDANIEFTTTKPKGEMLMGRISAVGDLSVTGASLGSLFGLTTLTVSQPDITITGDITQFGFQESGITHITFSNCDNLESIILSNNEIESISFSGSVPNLSSIQLEMNKLQGEQMTSFINSLPDRSAATTKGSLVIFNETSGIGEQNICTALDAKKATDKGWTVYKTNIQGTLTEYQGVGAVTTHKVTVVPATEGGRFYIKGVTGDSNEFEIEEGTVCEVGVNEEIGWKLETLTYNGQDIKDTKSFTVEGPGTLTGSFKKLTYTVTLQSNELGTISIVDYDSETLQSVTHGSVLYVDAQPQDNKHELTSLKVNGKEILPNLYFVVYSNVTVEATFSEIVIPTPETEEIVMTSSRQAGDKIVLWMICDERPEIEGATGSYEKGKDVEYTLTSSTVKIKGTVRAMRCKQNDLTALDVTKAKSLNVLYAQENALSHLDVSKNPLMADLSCSLNQISTLDVSNNPKLRNLYCYNNNIESLDLTVNSELEQLFCYTNKMSTLLMGEHPKLHNLICFDNNLSEIKVDQMGGLNWFWCFTNQFKGAPMDKLINDLPNSTAEDKELIIVNLKNGQEAEGNICTADHVKTAKSKGWTVYDYNGKYNDKIEYLGNNNALKGTFTSSLSVRYSAIDQTVIVMGAQPKSLVVVSSVEGVQVKTATTDYMGRAILDASTLANGVYLLSTGDTTVKILVQ